MAMYLKITDGTTTIDLLGNDATNSFNLLAASWAPNVAQRKRNQLGGNWAEDVEESIPLYAQSSSSAATVLANLDTLAALLDQARRWSEGEKVSPVILRYSPNSDTDYLEAVILGPPDNGSGVVLPPTFSDDLWKKTVDGVTLNFKRRGLWIDSTAVTTTSTTSSGNPAKVSRTFASSVPLPSPVDFSIEFTSAPLPTSPYNQIALVVTNDADNIVIVQGESLTKRDATGGSVGNVSVSGSYGGSVKSFTGGNGGYYDTSVNSARRVGAIMVAANTSTTIAATVRLQAASASWGGYTNGATVNIDASTTAPRVFFLPPVTLQETVSRVCIDVAAIGLQVDYLMFINMDSPETKILSSSAAADDNTGLKTWFQQRILNDAKPLIKNTNSAGSQTTYTPWYGDRGVFLSGNEIAVGICGVNGGQWLLKDAGATTTNFKLDNVSRLRAHLVPQ